MNINIDSQGIVLEKSLSNDILVTKTKATNKLIYIKVKRILDIVISTLGLIILSPVFLLLAIIIKLDSKGPVFFAHIRVGKNGKKFQMYKFRTMCDKAQKMIRKFDPEKKKEFEENYKLKNDPRITRVGKFLRKTSLDELPQIFNILKGDLSIVGPRAIITKELRKYGKNKEKFLSVTPGLTGYWQVNGRSDTTYKQRMEMELYYIDHMSFKLDVKIFFKTFIAVFKKEGAM